MSKYAVLIETSYVDDTDYAELYDGDADESVESVVQRETWLKTFEAESADEAQEMAEEEIEEEGFTNEPLIGAPTPDEFGWEPNSSGNTNLSDYEAQNIEPGAFVLAVYKDGALVKDLFPG